MKVTCSLCGQKEDISKMHKDYRKLAQNDQAIFICAACENKTRKQALKSKNK